MADAIVTLEQVRQQLKLEAGDERLSHVQDLLDAAQGVVEGFIDRSIALTWPDPTVWQHRVAAQAIKLLVGKWFVDGADDVPPASVVWLLKRIRMPRI